MEKSSWRNKYIVISNPIAVKLILHFFYTLYNLILNIILGGPIMASIPGNTKPNGLTSLLVGLVISELSYRIALNRFQKKYILHKKKFDTIHPEEIKLAKQTYIVIINTQIALLLNLLFYIGYSVLITLLSR